MLDFRKGVPFTCVWDNTLETSSEVRYVGESLEEATILASILAITGIPSEASIAGKKKDRGPPGG